MTTTRRQDINQYFTNPDNYPAISDALRICDGHTVFHPDDFNMLPEFVKDHFSKILESSPASRNPKGTIYLEDGRASPDLFGIYGLDLIVAVARAHNVHSAKNGRGFMAADLKEQLAAKLVSQKR